MKESSGSHCGPAKLLPLLSLLLLSACGAMPVPQWQTELRDVQAQALPLQPQALLDDYSEPAPSRTRIRPLPPVPMTDVAALDNGSGSEVGLGLAPLSAAAPATASLPSPPPLAERRPTHLDVARDSYKNGDYATTVATLREAGVRYADSGSEGRLLHKAGEALYRRQLQQGNLSAATELVQLVLGEMPGSQAWRERRKDLEGRRRADAHYQAYLQLPADTPAEQRYEQLRRVLELDPQHRQGGAALAVVEADLVEVFHQRALRLYRQQQLPSAIEQWQRLLELDAGHRPAQDYLSRARALQQRLDQLR